MSVVSGNNITLTASDIASSNANYIIRTPTADSNDTFDTANNLLLEFFGEDSANFIGSSFSFSIYNKSSFTITMNPEVGDTICPVSPDLILPQTIRSYTAVQTAVGTVELLVTAAASAPNNTDISLTDGNVLIGSSVGIASGVPMSGQASIINTGEITLTSTVLYDAVVDPAGNGDYTTLSAAVSAGEITIFLKEGTISETTSIVLPDNVVIIGENKSTSIVDFGGNAVGLELDNGSTPYITGTISVTNGSAVVTGSGTLWLANISPNDYIRIRDTFFQVSSVDSNTQVTIISVYEGQTGTGLDYTAVPMRTGTFRNFTVQNNTTVSLLTLNNTIGVTVDNMNFISGGLDGLIFRSSTEGIVTSCFTERNGDDGMMCEDSFRMVITNCVAKNNGDEGFHIDSVNNLGSRNIIYNSCQSTSNLGNGIACTGTGSDDIVITDCISNSNDKNGVNVTTAPTKVIIQDCMCVSNVQEGIDLDSMLGIISGCIISNNGNEGIDPGDETAISNCIIENNAVGIDLSDDVNCTITGCHINSNVGDGILFSGTSNENTVNCNQINNNGGTGVNIVSGASNNIISSNFISGNSTAQVTNSGSNTNFSGNTIGDIKDNAAVYAYSSTSGASIEPSGELRLEITTGGSGYAEISNPYTTTNVIGSGTGKTVIVDVSGSSINGVTNSNEGTGYVSGDTFNVDGGAPLGLITLVPDTIVLDTSVIEDTGYSLNTSTGVLTIAEPGRYQVSFSAVAETAGNAGSTRTDFTGELELNGSAIPGSRISTYARDAGSGSREYGVSKTIIVTTSSTNETLELVAYKSGQTTMLRSAANCSIYVKRMGP